MICKSVFDPRTFIPTIHNKSTWSWFLSLDQSEFRRWLAARQQQHDRKWSPPKNWNLVGFHRNRLLSWNLDAGALKSAKKYFWPTRKSIRHAAAAFSVWIARAQRMRLKGYTIKNMLSKYTNFQDCGVWWCFFLTNKTNRNYVIAAFEKSNFGCERWRSVEKTKNFPHYLRPIF